MVHVSRLLPALVAALVVTACAPTASAPGDAGVVRVVATVAPLADLVAQVAGPAAEVRTLVPPGTDSHTFEPSARDAARLAEADLFVANGLGLEAPSLALAEANLPEHARIVRLGDETIPEREWVYDRSFPRERGAPNPHAWLDVAYAMRYVDAIAEALRAAADDERTRRAIRDNAAWFTGELEELHRAIETAARTVPARSRKLLTYHDSWAYFGPRYGFAVVDAVQPPGMDEPSAADVRRVIEQIRAEGVPAVFGSEVFGDAVLETVAAETGVRFVGDLADDALPGEPGDPEHTYVGMMARNVRVIVESLGGDARALDAVDPSA